jgi:hypothetical protein
MSKTTDITELLLESVKSGLIDPPFAPHRSCRGNLKTLRAKDGSVRVTADQSGVFSKSFVGHEASILGKKKYWNDVSSDEVKLDLQYPFSMMNRN